VDTTHQIPLTSYGNHGAWADTGDHLSSIAAPGSNEERDTVPRGDIHYPLHTGFIQATREEEQKLVRANTLTSTRGGQPVEDAERRITCPVPRDTEPPSGPLCQRHQARQETTLREPDGQDIPVEAKRQGQRREPDGREDREGADSYPGH
jgi:hypothetical protein